MSKGNEVYKGKMWNNVDEYYRLVRLHSLAGDDLENKLKQLKRDKTPQISLPRLKMHK